MAICKGETRTGKPCKCKAWKDSDFCGRHQLKGTRARDAISIDQLKKKPRKGSYRYKVMKFMEKNELPTVEYGLMACLYEMEAIGPDREFSGARLNWWKQAADFFRMLEARKIQAIAQKVEITGSLATAIPLSVALDGKTTDSTD